MYAGARVPSRRWDIGSCLLPTRFAEGSKKCKAPTREAQGRATALRKGVRPIGLQDGAVTAKS